MSVPVGPYIQMALEQAPNYEDGTNLVSTYVCYPPTETLTDDEKMTTLEEQNLVRGFLARMPHLGAAKYEPDVKLGKVHPRPSHLGFLLALMMGDVTSTPGDGSLVLDPDGNAVPVGAYMHTYQFKFAVEPQTAQVIACTGDGMHRKATGVALSELDFIWENGALACDASGLALYLASISTPDPEITPVIDTALPFRRGDLTVSWLAGTALTREFTFKFNAKVEQIWNPLHASLFPTDMWFSNKAADLPFVSGKIDKATLNDADWAALADGGQFEAKIKVVHRQPIGETDYVPTLWIDLPGCELTKITRQAIAAERRREGSYEFESRYDSATGKLATVTLVNETPAYGTYSA